MTNESIPSREGAAGYLLASQQALFGESEAVGFGTDRFYVAGVERDLANELIRANHYSRKIYAASFVHLGVILGGELQGILQFGPAMNPASGASVVRGTKDGEYLELNRMWLADVAPRNSESRALSYSVKFIRRALPKVKWLQSFADERCGLFGTVYQAAGFTFHGEHTSTFWELDGEVFHNSVRTNTRHFNSPGARRLLAGIERATKLELRQFRYLKFMQPRFSRGCVYPALPYPKPDYAARPDRQAGVHPASEV